MKPGAFHYHRPRSLDETHRLLAELGNARILAGGQSLMPMLNFRVAAPDHLIDVNRVEGLACVEDDGATVKIGAMTRQRALELSPVVRARLPLLAEALAQVGHRATRNRGTIGGSLCHLDPAAELPLVAMVYDAALSASSRRGTRALAMADFALGLMTTSLEPDEILTSIQFRPWSPHHGWGFAKFARGHGAFSIANAAALIELDVGGRIARVALCLSGMAAAPVRLRTTEATLLGRRPDGDALTAAVDCEGIEPIEDAATPGWYRKRISATVACRALATAWERAQRAGQS